MGARHLYETARLPDSDEGVASGIGDDAFHGPSKHAAGLVDVHDREIEGALPAGRRLRGACEVEQQRDLQGSRRAWRLRGGTIARNGGDEQAGGRDHQHRG